MSNLGAIQKYGFEYIVGCQASSMRDDKAYGNGDGKLQANELAASMTNFGSYNENPEYSSRISTLNRKFESLSKKYTNSEGAITAGSKAELINSKEWSELLVEYHSLRDEMTYMNQFKDNENSEGIKDYYNDGKEALQRIDLNHGNGDGKVTTKEYFKNSWSLYKNLFKDDPIKLFQAYFIALKQASIMSKYTGPDGVLMSSGYIEGLNSEEYGKTLDAYWNLMGGRPE